MKPNTVGRVDGIAPIAGHIAQAQLNQIPSEGGLLAGAVVLTIEGEIPVEFIEPGDRVITRDTGLATVKEVRRREIICDAVRIKAGSLGHTRPDKDVCLPAEQQILIRDWRANAMFGATQAMVNARDLVDGEFVTLQEDVKMHVIEVIFERDHVIYADGLELASYASS